MKMWFVNKNDNWQKWSKLDLKSVAYAISSGNKSVAHVAGENAYIFHIGIKPQVRIGIDQICISTKINSFLMVRTVSPNHQ